MRVAFSDSHPTLYVVHGWMSQASSLWAKQRSAQPVPSWRNHIQGWMTLWECYCLALQTNGWRFSKLGWKLDRVRAHVKTPESRSRCRARSPSLARTPASSPWTSTQTGGPRRPPWWIWAGIIHTFTTCYAFQKLMHPIYTNIWLNQHHAEIFVTATLVTVRIVYRRPIRW